MKKRILIGSVAAGAVAVGAALAATSQWSSPLHDVEVPAVQLSSAEGVDATIAWLDLFAQSAGGNTSPLDANLLDWGITGDPSDPTLVILGPQGSAEDFTRILDGAVDGVGSQLGARGGEFTPKPGS